MNNSDEDCRAQQCPMLLHTSLKEKKPYAATEQLPNMAKHIFCCTQTGWAKTDVCYNRVDHASMLEAFAVLPSAIGCNGGQGGSCRNHCSKDRIKQKTQLHGVTTLQVSNYLFIKYGSCQVHHRQGICIAVTGVQKGTPQRRRPSLVHPAAARLCTARIAKRGAP